MRCRSRRPGRRQDSEDESADAQSVRSSRGRPSSTYGLRRSICTCRRRLRCGCGSTALRTRPRRRWDPMAPPRSSRSTAPSARRRPIPSRCRRRSSSTSRRRRRPRNRYMDFPAHRPRRRRDCRPGRCSATGAQPVDPKRPPAAARGRREAGRRRARTRQARDADATALQCAWNASRKPAHYRSIPVRSTRFSLRILRVLRFNLRVTVRLKADTTYSHTTVRKFRL